MVEANFPFNVDTIAITVSWQVGTYVCMYMCTCV